MLPIIASAIPWIASAVGAALPSIIDAFRSGKSPEEAQKIIAPHRKEVVDRLVGTGMNQAAAEAMADESMKGEFEKAQLPEPMNPWLSLALHTAGGIAGFKGGKALSRRLDPAAAAAAPMAATAGKPEATEASEAGEPPGLQDEGSPFPQQTAMSGGVPLTLMPRRAVGGGIPMGPFPR